MRIARCLVMTEPPSIDANEITDKGYLNQRAVLTKRAALSSGCTPACGDGRDRDFLRSRSCPWTIRATRRPCSTRTSG